MTATETIPRLTAAEIESRFGSGTLRKGKPYAQGGSVIGMRRQGNALKAQVWGTADRPYRVEVAFQGGALAGSHCSCPVGGAGYCKHVVAVLLTWSEHPEQFTEVEELDRVLEARSKEELIALVKQMLLQEPELEDLLQVPLPAGEQSGAPVDPQVFHRQAAAAFERVEYGWGVEGEIAGRLQATMVIGAGFARQDNHAAAIAVYEAVLDEVGRHFQEFNDEEGELGEVVNECVSALGLILEAETDPALRARILKSLFDAYTIDIEIGGRDIAWEAPDFIVRNASPEEKKIVAGWTRDAAARKAGQYDSWAREFYGGFLLELEEDELDDEGFLRICRETARTGDLIDRLLSLGRTDEAVEAATAGSDYSLLQLAGIFIEHGEEETIEDLILDRATGSTDSRLKEWLKQRYAARGDIEKALALAEELFHKNPNYPGPGAYEEIRTLARQLDRWEEVRPRLLDAYRQAGALDGLIRVHLKEGEVDEAVKVLAAHHKRHHRYRGEIDLEVARAAEKTQPTASIEIYRPYVESLVAARARPHYQEAAQLLHTIRGLYERMGELDGWEEYIVDLRDRTRQLRAFKEELNAVGL